MQHSDNRTRINNGIKASHVLLIDENGNNLGTLGIREARTKAQEAGLDLVEVSNNKKNSVCKLMDYGKYKYSQAKKSRKNKSQKVTTKEIKFRPNTGKNDLEYRAKHAMEFISAGNKVKLVVRFRGREAEHMYQTGKALLERFLELVTDPYSIDGHAKVEGKSIVLYISPEA